jgi:tetratricopeptide (TPR) repeat protein
MLPASGELLTGFAAFWLKQDDETQALALLDRVPQLAPTAATLTARAGLYEQMGRADEAIGDLQIALEQEPGSLDALLALGDVYRAKADYAGAKQEYEKAVALMPGVPTGYLRLADLANEQGDSTAAEGYVEAARAAEPGSLIAPDDGL